MIITEKILFKKLNNAKKVLLVEPPYIKKYPPLGLAKIKSYLVQRGVEVHFSDHILPEKYDLICITTLFTYYSRQVFDVIRNRGFFNPTTPIIVGGIFASIMPEVFKQKHTFVFVGYSKKLELMMPDKSIMNGALDDFWNSFSYIFTSRGCPNKCPYCVVWRIEPNAWINKKWKTLLDLEKPNIMVSDNNLSSFNIEHFNDVTNFLAKSKKKVLFNNGFDCKHITEDIAKKLSKIKFMPGGMRLAFDRLKEDGKFQKALELILKYKIPKHNILIFVLFNFNDRPQDAYYRARVCADYNVRPYPQYYRPLKTLNKKEIFVGKHWTLNLGRAFRYYWLMRGIYAKMTFQEYIESDVGIERHYLIETDIKMYNNNGRKTK